MNVLVLPMGGGKTHQLVKWVLAEPDRLLVIRSQSERKRLICQCQIPEDRIVTYQDVLSGSCRGLSRKHLAIDNVEFFLQQVVGPNLIPTVVSVTGPASKREELRG